MTFSKNLDGRFAQTNRLRGEGTDALLAAAQEAGVGRIVAQSYASTRYAREGGWVKTKDDPLDLAPVDGMQETCAAMTYLDEAVIAAGGIALRYGGFYGAEGDSLVWPVRKRQFPIVGSGDGVSSFIHLEDAAAATVLALEHDGPAVYNIVDDEPAPLREWLPVLADALGAKPPRRFPVWLARLFAGEGRCNAGDRGARRLEREGEARTRVEASLSELEAGLPCRVCEHRRGRRPRRPGRVCSVRSFPMFTLSGLIASSDLRLFRCRRRRLRAVRSFFPCCCSGVGTSARSHFRPAE